jgi:hypothetical protein
MRTSPSALDRRRFLKKTVAFAGGITGLSILPQFDFAEKVYASDMNIIGPKEGYSPQVGTLVSMMTWMRYVVLMSVKGLTQPQLDVIFDANSNSIGSLLMHLAATESYYQMNTFQDPVPDQFQQDYQKKWGVAMDLGEPARKEIKGHDLNYYTDILTEVREKTLTEFKKRDDQWLMKVDPKFFDDQPTNNYCKWFHVCEHESNHNGQIKWYVKRIPGVKVGM